jgi:hypothetical protein
MTQPKSRRRPPLLQSLAWFIPGLLAIVVAGLVNHPLTLIPLLLANALTMAAICHAIGFDPEPRFGRGASSDVYRLYRAGVFAGGVADAAT